MSLVASLRKEHALREIEMKLDGKIGEMDLRALSDAIAAVDRMLRSVLAEDGESNAVFVSDLKVGSACIMARADDQRVAVISDGLKSLRVNPRLPEGWNDVTLSTLRDLGAASKRQGVEGVLLGAVNENLQSIDAALLENAKLAQSMYPESLGSVSGRLFRYSGRNAPEASLEEVQTGKSVKLRLTEFQSQEILDHMHDDVVVWGRLRRDPWSNRVIEVRVRGISPYKPPAVEDTPQNAKGILGKDWTDGLDAVEWVRRQRDND